MKFKILFFSILLLTNLFSKSWSSANIANARSIGLAEAYVGLARGVDAPLWNPANLGLKDNSRLSLTILNFGANVYNNSFTKSQYETYNGAYWSDEDIEDILNSIPDDGFKLSVNNAGQLASFASGRFAFTVEVLMESKIKLVKDFFDFLLCANTNKDKHSFDNCDGEAWAIMSYNLSGAMPLQLSYFKEVAIGATVKYLQGFGYFNIIKTEGSRITTSEGETAVGLIEMENAGKGRGIAFDLGAAAKINNCWTVSLGLKNIISNINWNRNAEKKYYSFSMNSVDLFSIVDQDSIIENNEAEEKLSSISSSLPAELYLGTVYYHNKFSVVTSLIQGFSDRPNTSVIPKIAAGIEYNIVPWFPIRTGISIGGNTKFSSAFGIGFKYSAFAIDFGISNNGGFMLHNQKGANMALSMGLEF